MKSCTFFGHRYVGDDIKDLCGGAAKVKEIAEKKGKNVINIAEKVNQD